jgi:large subunit ribosomal protein L10
MSEKAIARKIELVEALKTRMQESNSVVLVDYSGLTVAEITDLRVELSKNECEFAVIKNNIIKRAASDAGYGELAEGLVGPNAVAFSNGDSVSAAKILYDFSKDHKALELKVGVVDDVVYNYDKLLEIAQLPSREQLLTMFAGGLLQPIKELAIALDLHAKNLEEQEA